ncbi:MAG TPA: YdeI/OmpD-associated family protein, partial [Thermoleophilia bacterium]|nr:YdeI/OmpD-associated family protein [Thermoleophilia bacterium]
PITSLTYEASVEEALGFGWIDSTVRRLDEHRFQQLYTPRRPGGNWAPSNKARVERLTAERRMRPAGLAAVEAAKADGSWMLLDDVENLVVPDDLAAALAADTTAAGYFANLPEGQKKQILYWIVSAKRAETRSRRIAQTVEAAREGRLPG